MKEKNLVTEVKKGFVYTVEHIRDGVVISEDPPVKNLVPTEALNDFLNVYYKGGTQQNAWYLALYEGNYTPTADATAATIAVAATETTAYTEATRPDWTSGTVASGAVSNVASKAEFTFNATKTIYGGFLISSSAKSSGLGVLGSVVRFPSPKAVVANDILRITAGITVLSV